MVAEATTPEQFPDARRVEISIRFPYNYRPHGSAPGAASGARIWHVLLRDSEAVFEANSNHPARWRCV